jgi:hypothetical protein
MPRRKRKGQGPRTRGRHKHFKSRETRVWNKLFRAEQKGETEATGIPRPDYDPRIDHPERYRDGPI